nr:hypothetical protein [Treponema sp.]
AYLCDAGPEALSHIKEYPFLSQTALFVGERFDGKGNSQKLKGYEIPEYARIVTVAKDYDNMVNNPSIPKFFIRDYFIRQAGHKYDPTFAKMAVLLLDLGTNTGTFAEAEKPIENELLCTDYRQNITTGIEITQNITDITFDCTLIDSAVDSMLDSIMENDESKNHQRFSLPSIILFDSSDKQVQKTQDAIDAHKYIEYGEIWFDSHVISTSARNIEVRNVQQINTESQNQNEQENNDNGVSSYKITACRYEDHILLKMYSPCKYFEVIIALPSASKSTYIGITGENVHITNIIIEPTSQKSQENDIPRIAEKLNFIDRIESDIPNVQISKPRGEYTNGVEIKENTKIYFHAQTLPDANLVWHCPYIILYSAEDKKVHGKNYHEYAMIKFDGEEDGSNQFADNEFSMKKTDSFTTWEDWEIQNKAGYECLIELFRTGNKIMLSTHNKGIFIQNTTTIKDGAKEVYITLSGDQVALTDIRIR